MTGVKWFPFYYDLWRFDFISLLSGFTRKRLDGSAIAKGVHDEIRSIYGEEFADRGMSHDFTERASHLFLKKGDDYTKYMMLEERKRVPGYRSSPVASGKDQKIYCPVRIQMSICFWRASMVMMIETSMAP